MIDTKIRKLLIGGNEEDLQVATALISKKDAIREGLYAFEDVEFWDKKMHLDKVRILQLRYPNLIISGSVALFLHGCRIDRWTKNLDKPDLDIIIPYYYSIEGPGIVLGTGYGSGNDFQHFYTYDDIKVDVRISNLQMYETVAYNGFKYKVGNLFDILEAKIRYGRQNNSKHITDIYDIVGKTVFKNYIEKVNKRIEIDNMPLTF